MKWINSCACLLALVLAITLYVYKFETLEKKNKVAKLNREMAVGVQQIGELTAEWNYLRRPERLANLAEAKLGLAPLKPGQIVKPELLTGALPPAKQIEEDAVNSR